MSGQPTTTRHQNVCAVTTLAMSAGPADVAVDALLEYTSLDPFAVRMVFSVDDTPSVEWVFGRDLLVAGLVGPSGHGDVKVFPSRDGLVIELSSPAGAAQLRADRDVMVRFVQDMLNVVPLGGEDHFFDIDREVALLADPGVTDPSAR